MATEVDDDGANNTFELACNDCPFERTVTGTIDDVLDVADEHREEFGDATGRHFVDFERVDL